MKLADNWRAILKRAWSVRLMLAAAVLSGVEVAVQVFIAFGMTPPIPGGLFVALAGLTTIAATIARIVAQNKLGSS